MIALRTPSCVSAGGHEIDRQPVQVQSDPVQSSPVVRQARPSPIGCVSLLCV